MTLQLKEERPEQQVYLDVLKRHGVIKAVVSFNGGGDSGDVNDITCEGIIEPEKVPLTVADAKLLGMDVSEVRRVWDHERRANVEQTHHNTLHDVIEKLAYDVLGNCEVDWCNNDGGYGDVVIIPGADFVFINMNAKFTGSHYHGLNASAVEIPDDKLSELMLQHTGGHDDFEGSW